MTTATQAVMMPDFAAGLRLRAGSEGGRGAEGVYVIFLGEGWMGGGLGWKGWGDESGVCDLWAS